MPPASKDSVIYAAIILVGVYVLIGFEVTNYDIEHFAILITYGPYCKKEERLLFPMHFVYKLFITYWLSFTLIYRHSYLRYFCLTFRPMIIFHRTASKIQFFSMRTFNIIIIIWILILNNCVFCDFFCSLYTEQWRPWLAHLQF